MSHSILGPILKSRKRDGGGVDEEIFGKAACMAATTRRDHSPPTEFQMFTGISVISLILSAYPQSVIRVEMCVCEIVGGVGAQAGRLTRGRTRFDTFAKHGSKPPQYWHCQH